MFIFIFRIAQEDKFILYAGLKSGPDSLIISNDRFTNFIHRLDNSYHTFEKWLTNRRVDFIVQYIHRLKKSSVQIMVI